MRRNAALDSLKALTVLLVAIFHYCFWNGIGDIVPGSLYLGVDLLFIVTGYTTMISLYHKDNWTSGKYWSYLAKSRIFRLWVPYIFLWALWVVILFLRGIPTEFYSYFNTFFLLQSMGFTDGGEIVGLNSIGIAWPLSAEFWIGLFVFPLIYRLRKHRAAMVFTMIMTVYLGLNSIYNFNAVPDTFLGEHMGTYLDFNGLNISIAMARCLIGFALGILVYYGRTILIEKWASRKTSMTLSTFILTLFEIVVLSVMALVFWKIDFRPRNTMIFPFFAAMLVLLVSLDQRKGLFTMILGSKYFLWFGKLYFGIFMMHPLIISILQCFDMGQLNLILFIALTLCAATVFYFTVERLGKCLYEKACRN